MGSRVARRQQVEDLLLGGLCTAVAVAVHLGGSEAVSRNLDPSPASVLLTVLAVGPVVMRRRAPLAVLAVTLVGLLALVATRNTVGVSTLGLLVAFYTAVGAGTRRQARTAIAVLVAGLAVGMAMRPVDLSAGGALTTSALLAGAGVVGAGTRERRERFEADVVAARERAARSAADERLRITRELHDIIGHALGVMVVQAGVAEQLLDTDPARARSAVAQIGATGRTSLAEMRQVLGVLRAGDPAGAPAAEHEPVPGLPALPALVDRLREAGLPVALHLPDRLPTLPQGLELAAYRVVQEALTNCLKHAAATDVRVVVEHTGDALRLSVRDNGTGPARPGRPDPARHGGLGQAGMRERVAVYGGRLTTGPTPEGGFQVEAVLPMPRDASGAATTPARDAVEPR